MSSTTSPQQQAASQDGEQPIKVEDQGQLLKESKRQVDVEAYMMRKALDKDLLDEALKHAAKMLGELRTSVLSPKNYYDLYMSVFDKLRHLEMHFREENLKGRKMSELYEVVQHAGNIVPRLYLLITVGAVYIKSKELPANALLRDLVDMCKGVQHPTRGLFLRHYLAQMVKDKLPDKGSEYEGLGGSVTDAIEFLTQNFKETVNLFSRLKNTGPVKEREKREKERMELRILVGTSLFRLSQLDGVDIEIYKKTVLPKVLEVITECKDTIAQQYLMEVIIQVFPDDFHIATLSTFLQSCLSLNTDVDLKSIYTGLMDRLANYAKGNVSKFPADLNVYEIFKGFIQKSVEKGIDIADTLSIQTSLINFSLQLYRENIDYVDECLGLIASKMTKQDLEHNNVEKLAKKLLLVPVEAYKNVLILLELTNYEKVLALMRFNERKQISAEVVRAALKFRDPITTWEHVNKLFELIKPLIKDVEDMPDAVDEDDFVEEQNLVAGLVHLFANEDTDVLFKVYATARKHFGQGGIRRINFTLAPLIFCYLQLGQRIHVQNADKTIKEEKVFQYIIEILEVLANQKPALALKLYLQSSMCADFCGLDKIVYELMSQAFMLYEEEDSKVQLDHLTLIINTLINLKNIDEKNFEILSTKTCQYSAKLLRKQEQCKAAFLCSHLFWPSNANPKVQNNAKALECLQWSLKIVKACMSNQQIPLFVEILNVYLYHFDKNNEKVTFDYLNGLIELINTNIHNSEEEEARTGLAPTSVFYNNTLAFLKKRKLEYPDRFREANVE